MPFHLPSLLLAAFLPQVQVENMTPDVHFLPQEGKKDFIISLRASAPLQVPRFPLAKVFGLPTPLLFGPLPLPVPDDATPNPDWFDLVAKFSSPDDPVLFLDSQALRSNLISFGVILPPSSKINPIARLALHLPS